MQKRSGRKRASVKIPLATKDEPKSALGKDFGNMCLLVFLYLLQGVPLGLSFGSIPFLLKSKLSFSDIAVFSLSSYPYSLKASVVGMWLNVQLFWSPIVDSYFIKSFGRRKSWIVPIQALIGMSLILLGSNIDAMLEEKTIPVYKLSLLFTLLVFLCATQDIAVDGWALTLLKDENKSYASTGLNTGYFLSFTVFLAVNSAEFCNKYLRSSPLEHGIVQLGPYLKFWGILFLFCDLWLILMKREKPETAEVHGELGTAYKTLWSICQMSRDMRRFIAILLVAKIGFIANEAVTGLKLLELGFSKEDLALTVLIDFPFEILFGYYAAKWSNGARPLRPWTLAYYGRLTFALLAMFIVRGFPAEGVTSTYFFIVIVSTVLSSFMSTVQFVSMGSFFTRISDPLIGGTYMTLLNTISNLGGTWPKYFVLEAVDYFTVSQCSMLDQGNIVMCDTDINKDKCTLLSQVDPITNATTFGVCDTLTDGYYTVGASCFTIGVVVFFLFIRPGVAYIETLPERAWRLSKHTKE